MQDGNPVQMEWFNELQRRTTSAENTVRIRKAVVNSTSMRCCPRVRITPTLVGPLPDVTAIPPSKKAANVSAGIPDSSPIEGRNHVILEGDPGLGPHVSTRLGAFLRS